MLNQKKVEAEGIQGELFKRRRSEIPEAERVESLRGKLYQKAKQEKDYKFYILYDKLFIPYMLRAAWKQVKSNNGAAGIDGMSVADVERMGVDEYLQTLGEELRKQTYRPSAVKRVMIPKANGGERPLGIPTVKDRIAQTVCKLVLEPIFEADFEESSYGFRPERSSKDAMGAIKGHLQSGKTAVLDADLSKYFDTIPHDKLLNALKERISDPRVLKLINQWLKVPVYEDGEFKGGKKNKVGTPQGGVISPLLANIYLHLLDRIVSNPGSIFGRLGISIVRYADDFVLMGKAITKEAREKLQTILERMGLALNKEKTKQIRSEQEPFGFLGHTIRYDKDIKGRNNHYWNICPGKKAEQRLREKISEYLHSHGHSKAAEIVDWINIRIRGWLNYFSIKGVSYVAMSKRRLRNYLQQKLNRYFNRKSQRKCRLYRQRAFEVLVQKSGLIDPTKYTC
jgi:group II intron reverse transcriptase/maturase